MSIERTSQNGQSAMPTEAEMARMIDNGEWDKVKDLLTPCPEEVERILGEEPMIDAAEVNRMLEITDEEIEDVLKSPPPEGFPLPKGQK
jgi:hypothetical protein